MPFDSDLPVVQDIRTYYSTSYAKLYELEREHLVL